MHSDRSISLQLKAEELLMFIATLIIYPFLDYSWWWYAALILAPDLGMLGYLVNTKTGALTYNFMHNKGLALAVGMAGYFLHSNPLLLITLILLSHSSMDRIIGYGLKYPDAFKHTHLDIE